MEVHRGCKHHNLPNNHEDIEDIRDGDTDKVKTPATLIIHVGSCCQPLQFFNDNQIVPCEKKTMSRNVKPGPVISRLVAGVPGHILADLTHSGLLLNGRKQINCKEIPNSSIQNQSDPR